jgi:hypothetical protein
LIHFPDTYSSWLGSCQSSLTVANWLSFLRQQKLI